MNKEKKHCLSIEEKLNLFIAKNLWSNSSLGGKVLEIHFHDGPLGVRKPLYDETGRYIKTQESIAYPSTEVLAATWNVELVKLYGESIANDCIDLDVDVILGPGVNIKRLPLNGRNFEYISEDPLVSGLFAKEYINGVQSHHIGTSLKHYCCNNSETLRKTQSMEIDDRTLHEIYLLPYKIALEAKPWTVMTSYNKVNGIKMCQNKELLTYLRNDLGFDGLLISDWDAVFEPLEALNNGLDLEFPFNKEHLNFLKENVSLISEERLNEASNHLFDLCNKVEKARQNKKITLSKEERMNIAQRVAEEGIVLLKNKDKTLPLNKNKKVIGIGKAFHQYSCGGGSSKVIPTNKILLDEALNNKGCEIKVIETNQIKDSQFDISIVSVGQDSVLVSENFNRISARLTSEEESLIGDIAKHSNKTIVVIEGGGCIEMSKWIDKVDAIIYCGFVGQEGMNALANILIGDVNPSGHLSETFPISVKDFLSSSAYEDDQCSKYEEKLLVGYRQFVTNNNPVLFPFGYGLSYSKFEYKALNVIQDGDTVKAIFKIKNISDIDGKDVVQIYVKENNSKVFRPSYELKGFKKIFIKKGKEVCDTIEIPVSYLGYYNEKLNTWITNSGLYTFMLGTSAIDIKLKIFINIKVKAIK